MKKNLNFQTMLAISGLAVIPFHFAQGQLVSPEQVIPDVRVTTEGRDKGEPSEDRKKGEPSEDRKKGEPSEDRKKGEPSEDRKKGDPSEGRGKGDPSESREKGDPTKGRGKGERGESGKARNRENDPAPQEANKTPVPAPAEMRDPVIPQVQTPRVTQTPMVPQAVPNPKLREVENKGDIRRIPLQPKMTPGNRPPNVSKGEPKKMPEQTAPVPVPVPTLPPAAPEVEKEIARTTERVEKEVNQRKTTIKTEADALDIIQRVIGGDGELSRSESQRDRRVEAGPSRDNRSEKRDPARDADVSYLLKRFQGKASLSDAPPSIRRDQRPPARQGDRNFPERDQRPGRDNDPRLGHQDHQHPIYNGSRHVQFRSRGEIPAILLAISALNRVQIHNYNELSYLPANGSVLPPEYRGQNSPVVSYQVDPNSMVSRDDILFLQGSTSFADRNSFETVRDLAVAMGDPSLARERFVVEGHASAEGGYESNLALSQRRAERIVRDIVRFGVSPDRLVPVGYGESEAAYSANDPEPYRQLDRKVVVFRLSQ